jgi:GntR family transcriptional repressor for pyruvate dehydrogenase complex
MKAQENLFSPIKSKRTFEEVSSNIKRLIFDGVLKPGDRLPSEIELSNQFNVSRQTIREALRILELSGFIRVQKGGGGGPLIKDTIINTISDLFLDAFRMEKISIEELTVARLEIEKMVLNHVMDNVKASGIEDLKQNLKAAQEKIEDNLMANEENIEFHNLLARASKNHVFVIVVGSIAAVLRNLLSRLSPEMGSTGDPAVYDESILMSANAVRYHEEILEAIIENRREKAIELLEQHLVEVSNRLKTLID